MTLISKVALSNQLVATLLKRLVPVKFRVIQVVYRWNHSLIASGQPRAFRLCWTRDVNTGHGKRLIWQFWPQAEHCGFRWPRRDSIRTVGFEGCHNLFLEERIREVLWNDKDIVIRIAVQLSFLCQKVVASSRERSCSWQWLKTTYIRSHSNKPVILQVVLVFVSLDRSIGITQISKLQKVMFPQFVLCPICAAATMVSTDQNNSNQYVGSPEQEKSNSRVSRDRPR
jgi:hypothetical protein